MQILDIGIPGNEPQQLIYDRTQMHFLRSKERKTLGKIEPHLISENAFRPHAGTVVFQDTMFFYLAE